MALKNVTIFVPQPSLRRQNWDNPLNELRELVKQIDILSIPELPKC